MAVVAPLSGIRYRPERGNDIATRLAPPYDVLDLADKERLLAADPANFVAIDLPHVPPKTAGPPEAYEWSRRQLDAWLADGTLIRDEQPAIYVYHQTFTHGERKFVRKMFFARLRLEEFGRGSVFPHEQTFGGPKEDRLALTKACQANLSPIFGLYPDEEDAVALWLEQALRGAPAAHGVMDGTENALWVVNDAAVVANVVRGMASKPIYIADGHHRYGTSLLYQKWLAEQKPLPGDHPANYVLCVFCAMEDAGLLILPTHRVVPQKIDPQVFRRDTRVEIAHLPHAGPDDIVPQLGKFGPQALAFFCGATGQTYMLRPREADLLDAFEPKHSRAWRRLALAFLHAYLLERVIPPSLVVGTKLEITYLKSAEQTVRQAREWKGAAFMMQPNTMRELREVCGEGDLMPQKSTFFYPKLASGLVVNPLE